MKNLNQLLPSTAKATAMHTTPMFTTIHRPSRITSQLRRSMKRKSPPRSPYRRTKIPEPQPESRPRDVTKPTCVFQTVRHPRGDLKMRILLMPHIRKSTARSLKEPVPAAASPSGHVSTARGLRDNGDVAATQRSSAGNTGAHRFSDGW